MPPFIAELNAFDITLLILILLLGIKGMINGFIPEFFGFAGLIGGVFAASRLAQPVADFIHTKMQIPLSIPTVKLIAFLTVLAIVWMLVSFIGNIIASLTSSFETSFGSRIIGFALAAGKYFLIFSLIVTALFHTPLAKENFSGLIKKSRLYPILDKTGAWLINLPPVKSIQIPAKSNAAKKGGNSAPHAK